MRIIIEASPEEYAALIKDLSEGNELSQKAAALFSAHHLQYLLVVNAPLPQPVNQPIPSSLRGHADTLVVTPDLAHRASSQFCSGLMPPCRVRSICIGVTEAMHRSSA